MIEAIVAMTISSVIVIMVSTVFLVQNQYYAIQLSRTAAHDNARTMTDFVASELRSVASGGVVIADSTRLVVRSPIVLAVVCAQPVGGRVSVHYEGGEPGITTDEVTGFAVRDATTGAWAYYDIPGWSTIDSPGGDPPGECEANGADTVGALDEFQRLRRLDSYHPSLPAVGDILMLYRSVEYKIQTSGMDASALGLFRGLYGQTLVELATGFDTTARFQYRTGGPGYADRVTGAGLATIDAIRIGAEARLRPRTGGVADVTYGWAVNVFLRNGG